jgi:hypothetical protein
MFDNIRNLLRSSTVVHVAVEGNSRVTKIEFAGKVEKLPNTILNIFDLLGYEINSDTIEIYDEKKCLGRGYIGDVAGVTVDIHRSVVPVDPPEEVEIPKAPSGLAIVAKGIAAWRKPELKEQDSEYIPCVILEGDPKITVLRFRKLRQISGAVIDDENRKRYTITAGTRVEIIPPSGKAGMGYVCDPTGQTMSITRSVTVVKAVKDKPDVAIGINFSGRIGRHATSDKLTNLMMMVSGRQNMITLILVALVANIVGVVLHI